MTDYVAIVEALRDEYRQMASWSRGTVDGRNVNDDNADALDALLRDARQWRSCPECQCPEFTCIRCGHLMSPDAEAK